MKLNNINTNKLVFLGGILGIISVTLYYISPSLGSWWYLSWEIFKGEFDLNINAFGYNEETQILEPMTFYVGLLIIIGSILAIMSVGLRKYKFTRLLDVYGRFLSSVMMLIGIVLFLFIILDSYELNRAARYYDLSNMKGNKVLYGNYNSISWGLGIGFYIALIATTLILIVSLMTILKTIKETRKKAQKEEIEAINQSINRNNLKKIELEKYR
ncbi:MAG: hypothetical protein ACFFAO_04570 [Candidatus Hermodarchaeota archaeon]